MTIRLLVLLGACSVLLTTACSDDAPISGCTSDNDCRNDRVCVDGRCQTPVDRDDTGGNNGIEDAGVDMAVDLGPDVEDAAEDTPIDIFIPDLPPDAPDAGEDAEEDAEEDVEEDVEPDVPPPSGPQIEVIPDDIEFGLVGLNVSAFAELTVRNVGDETLLISNVRLESSPSQGFAIFPPAPAPIQLDPAEEAVWRVRFAPTVLMGNGGNTPYANAVIVESDDADDPFVVVDLAGVATPAPAQCLRFDTTSVSFGFVAVDDIGAQTIALENCGSSPIAVESVVLADEFDDLALTVGLDTTFTLDPDETVSVAITYLPTTTDPFVTRVVATGFGASAEALVTGGAQCPVADAVGRREDGQLRRRVFGRALETFTLDGSSSFDPSGGQLAYEWTIDGPGVVELAPSDMDPIVSFVPDVGGIYDAELRVVSEITLLTSCNTASVVVDVFPADPELTIEVNWNNEADLDLHFVRSDVDGSFSPYGFIGNGPNEEDCFYGNPVADYGEPNVFNDNCWFQGDDTDGFGPEVSLLASVEAGRRYKMGVQYARALGTDSVTATATIRRGDETVELEATWEDVGTYWVPFIIEDDGNIVPANQFE